MAVTVAGFLERFPEFSSRKEPQLAATLAAVELRVAPTFGDERDEVVYLTLADTLSTGNQGRGTRKGPGEPTSYRKQLDEFRATLALSYRVGR